MLLKLFAQLMLATTFLQILPADAGVVEQRAQLPQAAAAAPSEGFNAALSLLYRPLPVAKDVDQSPKKVNPYSIGVKTAAVSALVVDADTGEILYQKQAGEARSIGSITKLMTALVFLEKNPDLNAKASILPSDVQSGAMQHLAVGDEVSVHDLLLASLVSSDNTATMTIARLSGMPLGDFVARMNEKASEIGLRSTTFADPVGLSPENRSVTSDIVALLRTALADPTIRDATERFSASVTGASGRTYPLENTNELLGGFLNTAPYQIVGGKTGYLPEAGYCIGMEVTKDGGQKIFVVVLGSDSKDGRLQDAKSLAYWAYQNYAWPSASGT